MRPYVTPRALAVHEIKGIVDHFAAAARRAIEAGFDGVQLHAGAGYLPMQFLSMNTNLRNDAYGGSALNRARFTIEVLTAIAASIGPDRTGLKITPDMQANDIADPHALYTYATLLQAMRPLQLAFLEMAPAADSVVTHDLMRPLFKGAYFAGAGLDLERGSALLAEGLADAIVSGRLFIANPDLPRRVAQRLPPAQPDPATFYRGGALGYVDYPPSAQAFLSCRRHTGRPAISQFARAACVAGGASQRASAFTGPWSVPRNATN